MEFNWLFIVLAGLIPTVIGYLWYGPVMGKQWIASTGKSEEWYQEQGNLPMIMGTSVVLSIFLAFVIKVFIFTTHGDHFGLSEDLIPGSHNTFGHGAMHGAMFMAMWIIPTSVINGMFERRGPKNYWIHIVYWVLCGTLMGGIVDTFA